MPIEREAGPAIPLSRWADRQLKVLAKLTGSPRIAALDGPTMIGERGAAGNYVIRGKQSAGKGGSRIHPTADGNWFALTILREDDRHLLPALVQDSDFDIHDNEAIAAAILRSDSAGLLERGRALGLTVATVDEEVQSPAVELLVTGPRRDRPAGHRPVVLDLSAIWAGPLVGHLLWLAGAEVVKVENPNRPDLIRIDDPRIFDIVNQGKDSLALDLTRPDERDSLIALIRKADFVIESSRVRALKQLGIDADALVREVPGLVWLSVTGHGVSGEPANWTGIGHDCGVAAGLARELMRVSGEPGYVGDALPDPLTGITAAIEGWRAYRSGEARRIGFAMSAIAARALAEERAFDAALLDAELAAWGAAIGRDFPRVVRRPMLGEVHPLGADNAAWLARC